ncbi:hypothetical protein MTX11_06155 [Acinetobacter lwoffii]|uniref:hypothetical protein n=1 Tax=Acinetobacter lwoffii TaxID=28090 RepID=UPI001FB3A4B7|nr:hypothetical protein [Acinetobacter lwoffii]MCJ0927587.1 hypothetical protein [Acinetobacter lwoffii]MCO8071106.1 hypothetical protein [Acinetobacter lwoffii]
MMHFYKTQRGIEVLQDRSIPLTARQRRLLVLIGSQDFNLLNDGLKQQLAPAELLDQLYAMDLIVPAETGEVAFSQKQADARTDTKVDLAHSEIHRSLNSSIAADSATKDFTPEMEPIKILQNTPSAETDSSHEQKLPELKLMSFEDLKYMMMESLQKYCGLMAKQQIHHILQAPDVRSLKLCQMQWITSLQESRIAPQKLNHILKQINFALDHLQQNEAPE